MRYAYRSAQPMSLKCDGTPSQSPFVAGPSDRICADGTVQSGLGDPRQAQLGVKVSF